MSEVTGFDEVMANLNKEIAGIEGRAMDGLFDAGLQIQRAAQQDLRGSVVTGNLRASAYTRRTGEFVRLDDSNLDRSQSAPDPSGQIGNGVEIGFTANYAVYVHENMEGRSPKFLQRPIERNQQQIIEIIKRRAKV